MQFMRILFIILVLRQGGRETSVTLFGYSKKNPGYWVKKESDSNSPSGIEFGAKAIFIGVFFHKFLTYETK